MSNRYAREPGTRVPREGQYQAVWAWIAALDRVYDRPEIEGARHAAEWTLGLTDLPPISGRHIYTLGVVIAAAVSPPDLYPQLRPATVAAIVDELNLAADLAGDRGQERIDRDRAGGVHGWLAWWTGTAELAPFLVPDPDRLPSRRQAPAA